MGHCESLIHLLQNICKKIEICMAFVFLKSIQTICYVIFFLNLCFEVLLVECRYFGSLKPISKFYYKNPQILY
jgi:hypothetical protein